MASRFVYSIVVLSTVIIACLLISGISSTEGMVDKLQKTNLDNDLITTIRDSNTMSYNGNTISYYGNTAISDLTAILSKLNTAQPKGALYSPYYPGLVGNLRADIISQIKGMVPVGVGPSIPINGNVTIRQ